MTPLQPFRFFWCVLRPSVPLAAVCLLLPGVGVALLATDPDGFDQAFAMTLLLQMFAASTGYYPAATRGHYDRVLTSGVNRLRVAVAHLAVSTLPGSVVWVTLAAIDSAWRPGHWTTALRPSALGALVFVSVVAWSITLPFRRYAGAAVWLVSIVLLAATMDLQHLRELAGQGSASQVEQIQSTAAALVCPIVMLTEPASSSFGLTAFMAILATAIVTISLWVVCRAEIPLVDGA